MPADTEFYYLVATFLNQPTSQPFSWCLEVFDFTSCFIMLKITLWAACENNVQCGHPHQINTLQVIHQTLHFI